jgi:1,2-phenylacetyl-CoA epoxidase catalytic subunit
MTALHVSRRDAPQLTPQESAAVTKSLQQFQLGEGSKGQRLLDRGKAFGNKVNDPCFVSALELFIKEEQQHSQYLADFMQSQNIPLISHHWIDTVFRRLRGLAGLEVSLTVLVTAELIAVPYYRGLREATGSLTLRNICTRILEDETAHLRFQASMLARAWSERHSIAQRAARGLHWFFLLGTIFVVWAGHRSVFQAGGYCFRSFHEETLREFCEWEILLETSMEEITMQHKPVIDRLERTKS